jgi:hypothetical protein
MMRALDGGLDSLRARRGSFFRDAGGQEAYDRQSDYVAHLFSSKQVYRGKHCGACGKAEQQREQPTTAESLEYCDHRAPSTIRMVRSRAIPDSA